MREDLDALGIERAGTSREPEDHIAILLEVMAGLARGDFAAEFAEQTRFSSGISSHGRRGCSPISKCRNRRASTAPSAVSAASSWNWDRGLHAVRVTAKGNVERRSQ